MLLPIVLCCMAAEVSLPVASRRNRVVTDSVGLRKILRGGLPVLLKVDMPRDSMTPTELARETEWGWVAEEATATRLVVAEVGVPLASDDPEGAALLMKVFAIKTFADLPRVVLYTGISTIDAFVLHDGPIHRDAMLSFLNANGVQLLPYVREEKERKGKNVVTTDTAGLRKLLRGRLPVLVRAAWFPELQKMSDDGESFVAVANASQGADLLFVNLTVPFAGDLRLDEDAEDLLRRMKVSRFQSLPAYWLFPTAWSGWPVWPTPQQFDGADPSQAALSSFAGLPEDSCLG
eukprot:Hpha_TRINITY_DN16706_c1_g3::TRINITY_DN16706_c1_g3_i1::g.78699::m.78699